MNIRNKLILMLAIPLAALALVGGLGFRSQSTTAAEAVEALDQDSVVQSLNRSIKAIGGERLAAAESGRSVLAPVIERRLATDAELAEALALSQSLGLTETVDAVQIAIDKMAIVRATGNLQRIVSLTTDLRAARDEVEVNYPTQETFALAAAVDIAVDIADRQDSIWLEYINQNNEINTDLARRLRSEIGATELLRQQIVELAPIGHEIEINESLASSIDANIDRAGIDAINLFDRRDGTLLDSPTLTIVAASHNDWHAHAISLQDDVRSQLAGVTSDAEAAQNLFALLASIGLLVLLGLIYTVYRSVVRPLDELLVGAEEVASFRLPNAVAQLRRMGSDDAAVDLEPLPRENEDELGALVDAFNDVQLTAFDLALQQARSRRNIAEMFVNLGRRNQKLLQRILSVISELESDEKDPDKLERLFELDHMTTRMRRNAESLLVVAGTTTPRQWAKAVPAADAVRSALAEVQDYHRVDILSLADAPMSGNAVADVTHLLAELLENSLQFSDPGSRVSLSSRWKDGNYRIVITDQGFGMTPEELAEHNALIASPPPPDEAPTRFLGMFVVGHLAARHNIDVTLTDATIGGTDARITIPGSLMAEAKSTQRPAGPIDAGLPLRGEGALDLDAELAALTADTPFQRETAPEEPAAEQAPAPAAELPPAPQPAAEAAVVEAPAPAPVTNDVPETPAAPAAPAPAPAPVGHDLPVRGNPGPAVEPQPAVAASGLSATGEARIDFGEVPEIPRLSDLPAAKAARSTAAVAELPTREPAAPVAPAATDGLDAMGLPQRNPRATLTTAAPEIAASTPAATPELPEASEPESVSDTATNVGSMFSAFQAGVQRGEQTRN